MKSNSFGNDMSVLLMSAFQQTGEGIAIVDLSGTILYLNKAFAQMHGYTEEELTGMNLSIFHLPEHMPAVIAANRQVAETGSFSGEIIHLHRSGSVFPTLMQSSLVNDEHGKPLGIVGTLRDISDLKESIQTVEDAHKMLMNVLDAIPDIIGIQDANHGIIQYNKAGYSILNTTFEEVRGKKCYEIIGNTEPCEICATSLTYRTLKPQRVEKYLPELDKWLDVRSYPILNQNGEIDKVIEHLRDITRIKESESHNRKLEEQIRVTQKLESMGVLAGGIAHDFNNILMAILGNADLAILEAEDAEPISGYLRDIVDSSRRAADLAGQMLDYSGRRESSKIPVNINRIIHETGHMLSASVSRKTSLEFRLFEPLPTVLGDPTQLRQVIMNLITNASEALNDRTGTVLISTSVKMCSKKDLSGAYIFDDLSEGEYVTLSVTDSGTGMAPDTITRVFDPFFTTKFTGRGLGLAAVLGVVRSHLGTVFVDSQPGLGSVFTVYLPVSGMVEESPSSPGSGAQICGKGCILVIDDEEAVRIVTGRMLERLGYTVVYASDGQQAVSLYRKTSQGIKCVILDLTMPVMDGLETFQQLARINPDAKVIISSGFSLNSIMKQFSREPIAGILHKPYSIDDVSLAIRKALMND